MKYLTFKINTYTYYLVCTVYYVFDNLTNKIQDHSIIML